MRADGYNGPPYFLVSKYTWIGAVGVFLCAFIMSIPAFYLSFAYRSLDDEMSLQLINEIVICIVSMVMD